VLGDPLSMLVLRDVIFGNRRHFRELLQGSEEGMASNILTAGSTTSMPSSNATTRPRGSG
jgi:hypothetical protein